MTKATNLSTTLGFHTVSNSDPRGYLETEGRIIAENETHIVIALRIDKPVIARNLLLLAALADIVPMESPMAADLSTASPFHDPRDYLETEGRIIAENETHIAIALRIDKRVIARNLPLLAALACTR